MNISLKKSYFITFEGIDGSGKTTQSKMLYDFLSENFGKENVVLTKEPSDDTQLKSLIRDILLNSELDIYTQLFLFLADRKNHYEKIIKPALKQNKIVICDRYIDSTVAYQLEQIKTNFSVFNFFNEIIDDLFIKPNITFLLDIDIQLAEQRIKERNNNNFMDKTANLIRVKNVFLELAKGYDRIITINCRSSLSEQDVFDKIRTSFIRRLHGIYF